MGALGDALPGADRGAPTPTLGAALELAKGAGETQRMQKREQQVELEVAPLAAAASFAPVALDVVLTEDKGRVLVAREDADKRDVLLLEYPLVEVMGEGSLFETLLDFLDRDSAIMYWGALHSLTMADFSEDAGGLVAHPLNECSCCGHQGVARQAQEQLLLLQAHSCAEEQSRQVAELLGVPPRSRPLFHRLFEVWSSNCFDLGENGSAGEDAVPGGVVYFLPSMLTHSCRPNCVWHYDQNNSFVLRAREDIEAGEELTITYLDSDEMKLPTGMRREILSDTKHFRCCCVRCEAPVDPARTFRCAQCLEVRATLREDVLHCAHCGTTSSRDEAVACEQRAEKEPAVAEALLGAMHWLAERSWGAQEAHDLQKRLGYLSRQGLWFTGEPPRVLEALGDLQADPKSSSFDLAEAATTYSRAAELYADLFGDDHEHHAVARRKRQRAERALRAVPNAKG